MGNTKFNLNVLEILKFILITAFLYNDFLRVNVTLRDVVA